MITNPYQGSRRDRSSGWSVLLPLTLAVACHQGGGSATPTTRVQEDTIPADVPLPADALVLSGLVADTFNARQSVARFQLATSSFDLSEGSFELRLHDIPVDLSEATVTTDEIAVPLDLADGRNELSFRAYDDIGRPLFFAGTFWAGDNTLQVHVVDGVGEPLAAASELRLALSDDSAIAATATTVAGSATFANVPSRTVVAEARTQDNQVGVGGGVGNEGQIVVAVVGFGLPSAIANNDIALGTDGWEFTPGTVSVVAHEEGSPGAFHGFGTDNDLLLTTQGEGPVTLSRTFTLAANTTSASIRYRFITSEVPGGYFGTEYNDYFSVSIRAQAGGTIANESNTMNGLGLATFDPATGATGWRVVVLDVDGADTVQVDVTVANVADGLYDSSVVVDLVAEEQEPVRPSLQWDPVNGGLRLTWTVEGGPLQQATPIEVYWAGASTSSSRIGPPLFTYLVPAGTAAGPGGPVQIPGNALAGDPAGARFLLATTSETNTAALTDVAMAFGPNANTEVVPEVMFDIVRDALRAAGQAAVTITSTARTPADQARVMFKNLTNPARTLAQNIQSQLTLYGQNGDQVIAVFQELTNGFTTEQALVAEATIRAAMLAKIEELGPANVSKHCADPTVLSVIDVGRAAFQGNAARFDAAARPRCDPGGFFDEPANGAFHLQKTL